MHNILHLSLVKPNGEKSLFDNPSVTHSSILQYIPLIIVKTRLAAMHRYLYLLKFLFASFVLHYSLCNVVLHLLF